MGKRVEGSEKIAWFSLPIHRFSSRSQESNAGKPEEIRSKAHARRGLCGAQRVLTEPKI